MKLLGEVGRMGTKEELRQEFHKQVIPKLVWKKPLLFEDRQLMKEWIAAFNPDLNLLKHYTNKNILFEIVKYQQNNELIFHEIQRKGTSPIRHLMSSKVENLLFLIYLYKVLEVPKTFYYGLANFKSSRPVAPYRIREKMKWQEEFWTGGEKAFTKYVKSYNFGLDIDGETFEDSYSDAKKVFEFLNKFNIRFSVWCSGKKGWHYIIPYEEFAQFFPSFNLERCVAFCKALMLEIVKKLKLKKVDDKIYSVTRYLKTPYSIDSRNGNIIYPLTDEEFLNFDKSMMTTEHLLKNKDLGFRGTYCGRKSNPQGFTKLVEYFD